MPKNIQTLLAARFSDAPAVAADEDKQDLLQTMAGRGSCRAFRDEPVEADTLDMLCAIALSSPTKSDLQQRDIILLHDPEVRQHLASLVGGQAWVGEAPMLAVFCGNNRRQRLLHEWQGVPFANDHLDALFNATADAAIALGAFVTAAEVVGLGCCPISAVRNQAHAVSDLLGLPAHVFPFAGLAIGHPRAPAPVAKRLPLHVTRHIDRYGEDTLRQAVQTYDSDRAKSQPYAAQRFTETFGESTAYSWSTDKVRQYSQPERADFGAYIRKQGFCLD